MRRRWGGVWVATLTFLLVGERLQGQDSPIADPSSPKAQVLDDVVRQSVQRYVDSTSQGERHDGAVRAKAQLFDDVIRQVAQRYVDSVSQAELYDVAARAVIKHLNDRYTALLAGESANMWDFGGIGVNIAARSGSISVISLFSGSPAAKADIHPGDRIIEVAGKSTAGWTLEQIINALRGEVGSQVAVAVRRVGIPKPLTITLTRAKIEIVPVRPGLLLEDGIGYIALDAITPTAAEQLKEQVFALKAKGMRALVLDLRSNGGGDLGQSVGIADLFLDSGREIASTRGRIPEVSAQYSDDAKQLWPDLPIVVLVSPMTASGAELITAALQDNDRAVVVGTVTFGKGVGQNQESLNDSVALRLTTFRWYTPTGRNINRAAGDTASGRLAEESSDSALRGRPLHRTLGGRQIRGGSGLVPDLIVQPTPAERTFNKAVGYDRDLLPTVLTAVAFDVKKSGTVKSEDLKITPAMRQAVHQLLQAQGGTTVPEKTFTALGPVIDEQLSHEIAYHVFGLAAALRYDKQVRIAIGLLRKAQTPQDLLRLGTSDQGYVAVKN